MTTVQTPLPAESQHGPQAQMHWEEGTKKPCRTCKWQTPDPTDPMRGQCTINRHALGGVWKRWVRDVDHVTCARHEEGELSFRDHV